MSRDTFLDSIRNSSFQEYILEVRGHAGEMTLEIKAEKLLDVMRALKEKFGFSYLTDITATDFYTDQLRFEVTYNVVNLQNKQRLRVSCRLEETHPELDSLTSLWMGADWHEREAWDMLGIHFRNHPDLRRIYLPEDFEYHPLLKEFPQLGIPGSINLPEKDPPKDYK